MYVYSFYLIGKSLALQKGRAILVLNFIFSWLPLYYLISSAKRELLVSWLRYEYAFKHIIMSIVFSLLHNLYNSLHTLSLKMRNIEWRWLPSTARGAN